MLIFRKMSDCIYYYLDSIKATRLKIKIEHFKLNDQVITVFYRMSRQKILNEMPLNEFSHKYFENISNYDQHRLTKFSTLQKTLLTLFINDTCSKDMLYDFIKGQIKNEQLL